tara:strand:- start:390 stop:1004 length:615 start_codon:yes stop_codon:yes gene_type:complete
MDTGNEMLLDAVYLAVQNISGNANVDIAAARWFADTGSRPAKENFSITWRPNSERIVIVFSDEVEQSFLQHPDRNIPGRPITKAVVENAVAAGIRLKVYAFSGGGWAGQADFWTDISSAGNGANFDLTSDALSMYNDLMSIIDEACLPREEQGAMTAPIYRGSEMSPYYAPIYLYETHPASFRKEILPVYYDTVLNYCVDPNND